MAASSSPRSSAADRPQVSVPPDFFACDDCVRELADPGNRRYRYPFINCTQCGPRYTLIESLPYDRPNTSMARFELCADCRREYEDPLDRRFHAEPIACPVCGPHLEFTTAAGVKTDGDEAAIAAAIEVLKAGRVLAVRGIGGYHLLCDARSETAVTRLRERKRRPHKPLAVMFPQAGADGLEALRAELVPSGPESDALLDPARPIVLARHRDDCGLAACIAPGLAEVGAMLPYSPLHHLLLDAFGGPGGRHVRQRERGARPHGSRGGRKAPRDGGRCVPAPRPAHRPAGRRFGDALLGRKNARPIRLGRGTAPLELELPARVCRSRCSPFGGHLKLAVALAWDRRVVVSPHIGDMGTPRSEQVFEQVVADLQRLYDVTARHRLCDAHPGYTTTRWVRSRGQPYSTVLHHHAHASALVTEHGVSDPAIVFAWDGVGYGGDGTLWGGETLHRTTGRVESCREPSIVPTAGGRQGGAITVAQRSGTLRGKPASIARSRCPIRSCARPGAAA